MLTWLWSALLCPGPWALWALGSVWEAAQEEVSQAFCVGARLHVAGPLKEAQRPAMKGDHEGLPAGAQSSPTFNAYLLLLLATPC